MISYDVIIRPIITERSMAGAAEKRYVFEVAPTAGKIEIKKAVEEIFGVKVAKVNTMNVPGKAKRLELGHTSRQQPHIRQRADWYLGSCVHGFI